MSKEGFVTHSLVYFSELPKILLVRLELEFVYTNNAIGCSGELNQLGCNSRLYGRRHIGEHAGEHIETM